MMEVREQPNPIVGTLIVNWLQGSYDLMDAIDFQELMVKHGYAERVSYDRDKHGPAPEGVSHGDEWYALTRKGRAARKAAE